MQGRSLLTWTVLLCLLLPSGMLGALCKMNCFSAPAPVVHATQINQPHAMHQHHMQANTKADTKNVISSSSCCLGGSNIGWARCSSSYELGTAIGITGRTPASATALPAYGTSGRLLTSEVLIFDSSPPLEPSTRPVVTALRI